MKSTSFRLLLAFFATISIVGIVEAATTPQVLWTQTQSTSSWSCSFSSTAMDASGNVYVAGSCDGYAFGRGRGDKSYVAKYGPGGNLLWNQVWLGTSQPTGVAVDHSGSVFVSTNTNVKKFSALGGLQWNATLPTFTGAIALDSAGNAFVGGFNSTTVTPCMTKITSAGQVVWTTQLAMSTPNGYCESVAADASGNSLMTFTDWNSGMAYVAKFDPTGSLTWQKQNTGYGCAAFDQAGSIFVTGDDGLRKYDADWNLIWTNRFSPGGTGNRWLALDPNGAEYVTGGSGIIKIDAAGSKVDELFWGPYGCPLAYSNNRLAICDLTFNPLITNYVSCIAVPEPSLLTLLGSSGILLVSLAWRRLKRK